MSKFRELQSIIDKRKSLKRGSSGLNPAKRFKLEDTFLHALREDEREKKEEKKEDKGSSSMDTAKGRKKTRKKKGKKRKTRKRRKNHK
tara:strand:- start:1338 stop:1601 length:264 start_codon:yes stop_codon:yes gene_type:complete